MCYLGLGLDQTGVELWLVPEVLGGVLGVRSVAFYVLYVPRAAAFFPATTAGARSPDIDHLTARCAYGPASRSRACPRISRGHAVVEHRQALAPCRPAWQGGAAGFLDLLLHQLHAHHPGIDRAGKEVRQGTGSHWRAFGKIPERRRGGQHPSGDPAL